jgi:hypothetical protein
MFFERGASLEMNKDDFTPDAIHRELLDYTINYNFPADELSEIGSRVYITGISDIEISSVTEDDSHFVVHGSATLEVDTDLGEGDKWSDGYPMQFSYEFDEDGKIVGQRDRSIDTSSFFEGGDDYEAYLVERSGHVQSFTRNTLDILSLLGDPISPPNKKQLHRLLYINVITALEVYLSDFFIARIKDDKRLLRLLFETTKTFKDQKISMSDVFGFANAAETKAIQHLTKLLWHRLEEVSSLYKNVLGVTFPENLATTLRKAINVRHELVHHNVHKNPDGTEHVVDEEEIRGVIKAAEELIDHIQREWLRKSSAG